MRFSRLHGSVLAGAFFLASSRAHLRIPAILSGTVMVVLALSGCTAAGSSSIPEPASTPTPPPAATAESALHESTNPDTVAWLTIPGTNIDGPVQQGPDNDYYLRRDSDGNEDYLRLPHCDLYNTLPFLLDEPSPVHTCVVHFLQCI